MGSYLSDISEICSWFFVTEERMGASCCRRVLRLLVLMVGV